MKIKKIKDKLSNLSTEDFLGGFCAVWAWEFWKQNGGNLCNTSYYGGHAFVKLNDLYYDAGTPGGVSDWRLLSGFNDSRPDVLNAPDGYAEEMSPDEFKKYWKTHKLT